MFTGLIEEIGQIAEVRVEGQSAKITLISEKICEATQLGDSIAVNGVCLTVSGFQGNHLTFDAVPETLRKSNLGKLMPGEKVNLERSLRADGLIGGHFVQGHVDGVGIIQSLVEEGNARRLIIGLEPDLSRCCAQKGSIAVDGISLTIAKALNDRIELWIIPHTWKSTTLQFRRVGSEVNIETDILAKYIDRLLNPGRGEGLTLEKLSDAGYI